MSYKGGGKFPLKGKAMHKGGEKGNEIGGDREQHIMRRGKMPYQ